MSNVKPRIELTINFIDYIDEIAMGNTGITQALIDASEQVINTGGQVIWLKTYENAEPVVMKVFTTEADLKDWKQKLGK